MLKQCTIHITIQFPETHTEVCPDDAASIELAIEDKAMPFIVELFGAPIYVDDVTVEFSVPRKQYDDDFLLLT